MTYKPGPCTDALANYWFNCVLDFKFTLQINFVAAAVQRTLTRKALRTEAQSEYHHQVSTKPIGYTCLFQLAILLYQAVRVPASIAYTVYTLMKYEVNVNIIFWTMEHLHKMKFF